MLVLIILDLLKLLQLIESNTSGIKWSTVARHIPK